IIEDNECKDRHWHPVWPDGDNHNPLLSWDCNLVGNRQEARTYRLPSNAEGFSPAEAAITGDEDPRKSEDYRTAEHRIQEAFTFGRKVTAWDMANEVRVSVRTANATLNKMCKNNQAKTTDVLPRQKKNGGWTFPTLYERIAPRLTHNPFVVTPPVATEVIKP